MRSASLAGSFTLVMAVKIAALALFGPEKDLQPLGITLLDSGDQVLSLLAGIDPGIGQNGVDLLLRLAGQPFRERIGPGFENQFGSFVDGHVVLSGVKIVWGRPQSLQAGICIARHGESVESAAKVLGIDREMWVHATSGTGAAIRGRRVIRPRSEVAYVGRIEGRQGNVPDVVAVVSPDYVDEVQGILCGADEAATSTTDANLAEAIEPGQLGQVGVTEVTVMILQSVGK